jgi:hypothetical protein
MKEMVDDGAVQELSVGDSWLADLMFQPDMPTVPTSVEFELGIWPLAPLDADSTPRYHITAELHRRCLRGSRDDVTPLEIPGMMFGLQTQLPLPETPRVHGNGVIRVDRWSNVTNTFPETKRRCVVEGLTCINVPLIPHEDGRLYPDWQRSVRHNIERINVGHDFPVRSLDAGFYSVQISL